MRWLKGLWTGLSGVTIPIHVNEKILAAIKEGRPVARSTITWWTSVRPARETERAAPARSFLVRDGVLAIFLCEKAARFRVLDGSAPASRLEKRLPSKIT